MKNIASTIGFVAICGGAVACPNGSKLVECQSQGARKVGALADAGKGVNAKLAVKPMEKPKAKEAQKKAQRAVQGRAANRKKSAGTGVTKAKASQRSRSVRATVMKVGPTKLRSQKKRSSK